MSRVVCAGVRPEDQPVPCTDVSDRRVNPNNGGSPHLGQGAVVHEGGTGNGESEELCRLYQLQAGWTHWCWQGTASQLLLPKFVGKQTPVAFAQQHLRLLSAYRDFHAYL